MVLLSDGWNCFLHRVQNILESNTPRNPRKLAMWHNVFFIHHSKQVSISSSPGTDGYFHGWYQLKQLASTDGPYCLRNNLSTHQNHISGQESDSWGEMRELKTTKGPRLLSATPGLFGEAHTYFGKLLCFQIPCLPPSFPNSALSGGSAGIDMAAAHTKGMRRHQED